MLLSIQALLSAPNPDDPLDNQVADQWKHNEAEAIKTGKFKIKFEILIMMAILCFFFVCLNIY